jgi:hypothetical protein
LEPPAGGRAPHACQADHPATRCDEMFKKLKEKLADEVKQNPRLQVRVVRLL